MINDVLQVIHKSFISYIWLDSVLILPFFVRTILGYLFMYV